MCPKKNVQKNMSSSRYVYTFVRFAEREKDGEGRERERERSFFLCTYLQSTIEEALFFSTTAVDEETKSYADDCYTRS